MRAIRISESFVPVSEFKAQASDWLRKLDESGEPMVVTLNGRPAAVLLSPQAFDELTEKARFVEAVEDGLADAEAGLLHSQVDVARRMSARFRGKAK